MLSKKVPEIIEAFEVLKVVSSDVETRRDAEIRFKSMSDKASNLAGAREEGIKQGVKLGIQQGVHDVAKNMLTNGVDIEMIQKFTGLSKEEILKLK